ncbi:Alanine transaminase [Aphelenchoides besseyi]|nr:Alanine transaminase [Aphelenchoides besseyi]KAI6210279.1 Alanine transaminase [Aphelenchoides besseyi]
MNVCWSRIGVLRTSATSFCFQPTSCFHCTMSNQSKVLTYENINPNVKTMEYAVRGPIVIRAVEMEKDLATNPSKYPFKNVIKANIGDAHAMGQQPITFIRQVLACVSLPQQMDQMNVPEDVKEHARTILEGCGGHSAGAYSQSTGVDVIRKHVADFITQRDGGIAANPEDIILSGGASESIRNVLKLFINKTGDNQKKAGIMIPIPQYPLYSASIEEFNLGQIGYYLDEANGWALDTAELDRSLQEAKNNFDIKALVVINPGNPTGQVLSKSNIEEIIKFAHKNNLFVFADEVYQENVYAKGAQFHSFKKVLIDLGEPYASSVELASFYSVSKGYMGECGMRGGYVEFVNLDPKVYVEFKKMISAKLCSTVLGQAVIDCVVNPPKRGDPSYEQWAREKEAVLTSLKERAQMVSEAYSSIEGVTCNPVTGAMYAFPSIQLPQKAIEKAKSLNVAPDFFYVKQFLEETGVCVVPGSGFGQKDGTYHFRTTILPQPQVTRDMLERFKSFHSKFMKEYA